MQQLSLFIQLLKESFRDLLPIVVVILFFQLAIIQTIPQGWQSTAVGLGIVGVGLALFLQGLEIAIFPIGEGLAKDFADKGITFWTLIFGFAIGFGTTIAEPALAVIADKAAAISSGRIDANVLRFVVAGSVGFAIALGVWRIIKGHPIHYYIIAGYIAVVSVTFFAPKEIIGLAYDLGGVTTSTVTVPLVAALGIGLASTIKGRNPMIDGFGLIAFASLTPMIFVQIYGIAVYTLFDATAAATPAIIAQTTAESVPEAFGVHSVIRGVLNVIKDIIPILAIILFFQFVVIRKKIENIASVALGFSLVVIGLYAFILGLEMGLFQLGEDMALQLTQNGSNLIIYAFSFAIGFSTTMAEPALMAIAKKSHEISDGKINDLILRIFVASGVAFGIALGTFRIIDGGAIHYYIIAGYAVVIALTFMAPKFIIPIAYDSGGVTTSTVTVPLVAALGLGLATNIEGRNPLIDGFGLIAFASLFPMISVMAYGIVSQYFAKSDAEIEHKVHEDEYSDMLHLHQDKQLEEQFANCTEGANVKKATVNINESYGQTHTLDLSFSAVVVIVPKEKKEDAIHAAREGGASGVTMFNAQGMGLKEIENLYRVHVEANDAMLLFIVPSKLVDAIIHNIVHTLHITTTGDGIAFAFELSHIKGISLKQQHIFENELEEI